MTTHQWTPPVVGPQLANPPCWGNPRSFDPNSRECRSCAVQVSCKDRVDQQKTYVPYTPPVYTPPVYQSPWQQQQAPWSTNPWAQRTVQPWQAPQPPQPQPQQPFVFAVQNGEIYGRYNDPIHYAMASTPLPPRFQMQGETFFQRFMKNAFLGMLEAAAGETLKGVRQMVLPPSPPNKIIDIK